MKFQDLTGARFNRLSVSSRAENIGGKVAWVCKCDCGASSIVMSANLRKGHSQSCGCLQKERTSQAQKKHGKASSAIYRIWRNMLTRCQNKNVRSFADYGARGIAVCERWQKFENFYADMGDAPIGKTLDRVNVNGDYEPANCKWASLVEQQSNTRRNRYLTLNGRTQTISAWARETGINSGRIWLRLSAGWTVESALTTPVRKMKRKSEWQIPPRI